MAKVYTDNYNLDLYTDTDPDNLRDQYNNAMYKVDNKLDSIEKVATNAQTTGNNAITNAAKAQTTADKAQTSADKAQTTADTAVTGLSTVYTKNESNQLFAPNDTKARHVLLFGDSYTDINAERAWWNWLQNMPYFKDPRYKWHNYAVAGYGYIPPNGTFASEFITAKGDTSYDHKLVNLIYVAGSRNSNDSYQGQIKIYATQLIIQLQNEFPNARIIMIPMLWDYRQLSGYWRYNAAEIEEAAAECGVESIPWAWTWNYGYNDPIYFQGNDIHPQKAAAQIIARYVHMYMLGSYTGRHEAAVFRHPTNPAAWNLTVNASGGTISYGINVVPGNVSNELLNMGTLPRWAWPDADKTNSGQCWNAMITNGANGVTLFKVNPDGTFGFQPFTSTNGNMAPNGLAGGQFTTAW